MTFANSQQDNCEIMISAISVEYILDFICILYIFLLHIYIFSYILSCATEPVSKCANRELV